ncbi:MAG: (2Fe-2S) ferredoxin domain-containing protein [Clostridiales bacterium]|nr:(2Fe-2S) ferredoxin domain-containing protein [Clostridiales bacterium]
MKSIADIKAIRDKMQSEIILRDNDETNEIRVVVGMATCGISAGARPVFNTLIDEVAKRKLTNVKVTRTGCLGMCKLEPIVEVFVPNQEKVTYVHVDSEKAMNIIVNHIVNGNVCKEYLINDEE